jgi:hypothetical protein
VTGRPRGELSVQRVDKLIRVYTDFGGVGTDDALEIDSVRQLVKSVRLERLEFGDLNLGVM